MNNISLTLDIPTIMILFGLLQAVLIMVVVIHKRGFAQHNTKSEIKSIH